MLLMKRFLLCLLLFMFSMTKGNAQIFDPIEWSTSIEKISDTEYNLVATATLESGWHLPSQETFPDDVLGPIPTEFTFLDQENNYELLGSTSEPQVEPHFDPIFQIDLKNFDGEAIFKQKINVLATSLKQVKAIVFFSVCDDEKCLAPEEVDLVFDLVTSGQTASNTTTQKIDENSKYLSEKLDLKITGWDRYQVEEVKEKSHFSIFLLGFLGGFIALLTPCVFPMIPLTVSFFSKSASNSQKGMTNSTRS